MMGGYGICERLVRSSHAATLARQHRAGFYELPELVVSGFARELREAADLIQQQQATIERLSAALEDSNSKLRNVISHASGGHLRKPKDIDRSCNDICVEISRHHNRIWEHAQKAALWRDAK